MAEPFETKTADFVVGETRVTIVLNGERGYVSYTGTMEGGGQIADRLRELVAEKAPGATDVIDVCDDWDKLHLKPLGEVDAQDLQAALVNLGFLDGERYGAAAFEDLDEAEFSNGDETIDSRVIISRIEALTGAFEAAGLDFNDLPEDAAEDITDAAQELKALKALEDEAEDVAGDWRHGETLIRESYFTAWAEEYVSDIGDLPREIPSYLAIDWEKTANNLKVDYTEVDFDGVTYLIR